MRSTCRDAGDIQFGGRFNYNIGMMSTNGPNPQTIQFFRNAVGQYTFRFDPSLLPMSVQAVTDYGAAITYAYAPGTFQLNTANNAGALVDISNGSFTVHARKMGV